MTGVLRIGRKGAETGREPHEEGRVQERPGSDMSRYLLGARKHVVRQATRLEGISGDSHENTRFTNERDKNWSIPWRQQFTAPVNGVRHAEEGQHNGSCSFDNTSRTRQRYRIVPFGYTTAGCCFMNEGAFKFSHASNTKNSPHRPLRWPRWSRSGARASRRRTETKVRQEFRKLQ